MYEMNVETNRYIYNLYSIYSCKVYMAMLSYLLPSLYMGTYTYVFNSEDELRMNKIWRSNVFVRYRIFRCV